MQSIVQLEQNVDSIDHAWAAVFEYSMSFTVYVLASFPGSIFKWAWEWGYVCMYVMRYQLKTPQVFI